jgi:hypothetical protein
MPDTGLNNRHDAQNTRAIALERINRLESGLSYNNIGAWDRYGPERQRKTSGLIPSLTVEGFLMGQPDLLDALTAWAVDRFPLPGNAEPYTAFTLHHVNPGDLRSYARTAQEGEETASLVIDGRFMFEFGYRPHLIDERYTWGMIGGLRIDRYPDGTFDFGTHT